MPSILSTSDKLAVSRTSLAYDRTLLAWVRTAIGIIGFGFSFYKFFQYLGQGEDYVSRHRFLGPREYASILIIFGNVALLLALADYFRARKHIKTLDPGVTQSKVPIVAFFVIAFGLFTLVATLLHV